MLTIRNESKISYPMNQTGLQTPVYQIVEHEKRLPGFRQKSFQYRSAVMQPAKIYLVQLKEQNKQTKQCF